MFLFFSLFFCFGQGQRGQLESGSRDHSNPCLFLENTNSIINIMYNIYIPRFRIYCAHVHQRRTHIHSKIGMSLSIMIILYYVSGGGKVLKRGGGWTGEMLTSVLVQYLYKYLYICIWR